MTNLIKAVIKAMAEIENIEKNLSVGTGSSSYKGVADKDVRHHMRKALTNNGLVMIPISIEPKVTVSEWDQEDTWNGKTTMKHKTQVFTEVVTRYKLMHESGESIEVVGYGHGVDSQDKSAGKATTYALKYALLNTFLVPTGDIDDTDNTHSNDIPQKPAQATTKTVTRTPKQDLWCDYHNCEMRLNKNGKPYHRDDIKGFCNGMGYEEEIKAHKANVYKKTEPTADQIADDVLNAMY